MGRSSPDDKRHVMKREQHVQGHGGHERPGYLGNRENNFDVAEIQSRWNGMGVGEET